MAITLVCPDRYHSRWIKALSANDPGLEIRVWPDDHPKTDIELALVWNHSHGVLKEYPELGCISSMGAGVDHLFSDPNLPRGVPVVRLKDDNLVRDMADYVLLAVLSHFRQFDLYRTYQSQKKWHPLTPYSKQDFPVGIMGLGQLGKAAALMLSDHGFPVLGWKNSPGDLPGIKTFYGQNQLPEFLGQTRVLVCLLPLTPATRHILNRDTFSRLPKGAYIINAGRGGHLMEDDLLAALDRGHLSGACLDVFDTEPLDPSHGFWSHPGIRVTPHVSSQTDPVSVAPQVLENINRLRAGQPLQNLVNLEKGY
ncbi:MAG: glyoxylate/hydroxypyruvate reductase A [Desulfobacter sp.]